MTALTVVHIGPWPKENLSTSLQALTLHILADVACTEYHELKDQKFEIRNRHTVPAPPFCAWISDRQTAFTVTVFPAWPGLSAGGLCLAGP